MARADFQLMITTTSGFSMTIHDNGVGDGSPTLGAIVFNGSAGTNFTVVVSEALSKPVIGSATNPDMDLTFNVTNTTGVADKITISSSDTSFGPLAQSGFFNMDIGGTLKPGATVTYQTFQDTANNDFGSTSSSGILSFTSSPYSGSGLLPVSAATSYSLTQTITINYGTGVTGTTSGDAEMTATPAPAGLLLALSGMPVLGVGAWLRRRRTLATA